MNFKIDTSECVYDWFIFNEFVWSSSRAAEFRSKLWPFGRRWELAILSTSLLSSSIIQKPIPESLAWIPDKSRLSVKNTSNREARAPCESWKNIWTIKEIMEITKVVWKKWRHTLFFTFV